MKTATYKKISQKGLSPIIILIVLAVIGLGAFVFYNNSKKLPATPSANNSVSNNQVTQPTSETIPGLDKVDGSNYTFYYPKGYTKLDKKRGRENTVLYYSSPSVQGNNEAISLNISTLPTRTETPTVESCQLMAQFAKREFTLIGNKNIRIVDATPVDFIKSHGCDLLYVDDSVQGKLYYHEKPLWYKEGNDLNIYDATLSYLLTTSQSEKETLDLAVNSFILK